MDFLPGNVAVFMRCATDALVHCPALRFGPCPLLLLLVELASLFMLLKLLMLPLLLLGCAWVASLLVESGASVRRPGCKSDSVSAGRCAKTDVSFVSRNVCCSLFQSCR